MTASAEGKAVFSVVIAALAVMPIFVTELPITERAQRLAISPALSFFMKPLWFLVLFFVIYSFSFQKK